MKSLKLSVTALLIHQLAYVPGGRFMLKPVHFAQKFIEIYNTGNSSVYHAFVTTSVKDPVLAAANVRQLNNEFSNTGSVTIRKITSVSPTNTELTLQNEVHDSWWKMNLITNTIKQYKEHHIVPIYHLLDKFSKAYELC